MTESVQPADRIAMVAACPFPTGQGSQVLIRQLSEALARSGHAVHLVCYHFGERTPWRPERGLRVHRLPYPPLYRKYRAGPAWQKPLLDLLLAALLVQVIRRHRLQVIHAHNYEGLAVGLAARALLKTPVVFHSHNAISEELSSFFRRPIARRLADVAAAWVDRHLPRRADQVIALTERLVPFFVARGVDPRRIACLPPGIELERWSERPLDRGSPAAAGLAELERRLPRPVAVYAGNLDAYQNLPLLLGAFARVRREMGDALLAVVSRSEPGPCRRLAGELGLEEGVLFIDLPDFRAARAVFGLSRVALNPRTSWCGFPIKVLDYLAAGLPVVTCRGSAGPVVHGVSGWVVEDGDEKGFAAAILRLLRDPRLAGEMGREGERRVREEHAWSRLTREVERIYSRLPLGTPVGEGRRH